MKIRHIVRLMMIILVSALVFPSSFARGAMVIYSIGTAFSTDTFGTLPAGSPPWLQATFDDGGGAGSVTLTLENVNLAPAEFTREWDFNLDPSLDPTELLFSAPVKVGAFDDPTINLGVDAFQADGDGRYDIQFLFATSGMDGGIHRFGAGEAATLTITGSPTLTASSFEFLSSPAGGSGPFYTAAHIQGIDGPEGSTSVWATTPEPPTIVLAAIAASAIAASGFWRRRRPSARPSPKS